MNEFYVMNVNLNVNKIEDTSPKGFNNYYELTPINGNSYILYESDNLSNVLNYCKTNLLKITNNNLIYIAAENQ